MLSLEFVFYMSVKLQLKQRQDWFYCTAETNLDPIHLAPVIAVASDCSPEMMSVTTSFTSVLSGRTIPLYYIDLTTVLPQHTLQCLLSIHKWMNNCNVQLLYTQIAAGTILFHKDCRFGPFCHRYGDVMIRRGDYFVSTLSAFKYKIRLQAGNPMNQTPDLLPCDCQLCWHHIHRSTCNNRPSWCQLNDSQTFTTPPPQP